MDEIRKGHPKWAKLIAEWERIKRPTQMSIGGITYNVHQDAKTLDYFFKRADEKSFYESISWGG